MRYIARVGERQFTIGVPEDGHAERITFDGKECAVEWHSVGDLPDAVLRGGSEAAAHLGLIADTRSYDVFVRPLAAEEVDDGSGARSFEVSIDGRTFTVAVQDERARALAGLVSERHISGEVSIRAPMPGLVSNILATEGATVERGQTIVVLEAMKMENDLSTPRAGVVKSLRVTKGQTVNQGDILVVVGSPVSEDLNADDE